MEPVIVEMDALRLVGFSFFGDPFKLSGGWTEENEIGRLWSRFLAYWGPHRSQVAHVKNEKVMFELQVYHAETPQTGEFEVLAGVEVERLEALPVELSAKIIPAGTYAVFTIAGEQIASDWPKLIYGAWMSRLKYEVDHTFSLLRYDERFKGMQQLDESAVDVYIPVRRA